MQKLKTGAFKSRLYFHILKNIFYSNAHLKYLGTFINITTEPQRTNQI